MVLVDSSVWIEAARRQGRIEVKRVCEDCCVSSRATWCGPVKLEVLERRAPREAAALEFSLK
jgi:hypothetical protein